jgi:uncharacterized membrane protein (DUF4010 family)
MLGELAPIEVAGRLGLAIAMAVFVGLAFEGIYKREKRDSPGGIRTFPLLATLGAMLFLLDPKSLLPFVVGLPAVSAWLYAHIRMAPHAADQRSSLMIPTANLFAYTLGPIALTQPSWVVVSASVTAVILLESREALHRLVYQVAPDEVFTLGKFLILIGVVLPLLPNHPVIGWTPITPFQVWLALVAVSTLSYASYLLQRYLPVKSYSLLPAILGGLYSSTVTTVALARQQRAAGAARRGSSVGIVVATAIMYLRIAVVVALFNWSLAMLLLPALAGLCVVGVAIAVWDWNRAEWGTSAEGTKVRAVNPLQLGTALTFTAIFVAIAVASNWVRADFGQPGIFGLAAIIGATDADPFVLSLAQGSVSGMSLQAMCTAVLIAASSNNLLKAVCALTFGGIHLCRRPAVELLVLGLAGFVAAAIYIH